MSEPTTSSIVSGYAAYKLAIAFGIPAGLATIVVMLWVQPKSKREWTMALICTVAGSMWGGALLIEYLKLQHLAEGGVLGLMALAGVIFAAGLPAWVVVRAGFAWMERRKGHDLGELVKDAKEVLK